MSFSSRRPRGPVAAAALTPRCPATAITMKKSKNSAAACLRSQPRGVVGVVLVMPNFREDQFEVEEGEGEGPEWTPILAAMII